MVVTIAAVAGLLAAGVATAAPVPPLARPETGLPHIQLIALPTRPDPDAPRGAIPTWLPKVQWVMERWLPFNASDLFDDLDIASAQDENYLDLYLNTGRSLADLARTFGLDPNVLAVRLLRQRQRTYVPALYRTLLRRTLLVLNEPHLGQHLLFHWFHDWAMEFDTQPVYGLPANTVYTLEFTDHETRLQVAASQGISDDQLRQRALALEWSVAQQGVKLGALSVRQATERQTQLAAAFSLWTGQHLAVTFAPNESGRSFLSRSILACCP